MSNVTTATTIAKGFGFTQQLRVRDLIEMYQAAERPADLDELVVLVPSSPAMSRALAARDHRAAEFGRFLDGCVKPSDLRPSDATLFDDAFEEPMRYNFINPYGAGCDLAARWIEEGYSSVWLRSDKRVMKSRGMVGNGDDFRRGEKRPTERGSFLSPLLANRIALTNKRDAGGAIANAIRLGQRFPELCEPARLPAVVPGGNLPLGTPMREHPATAPADPFASENDDEEQARRRIMARHPAEAPSPLPIIAIPVVDNPFECPICHDPASFCDCVDITNFGKRAA